MRQGLCLLAVVVALQAAAAEQSPGKDSAPQGQRPRTDPQGDPLPQAALARFGTTRFRHPERIRALAFSPDGKTLASSGSDLRIRLWGITTGKERRQLLGHQGPIHSLTFSLDGKTLISRSDNSGSFFATDGTVRLWEPAAGKERKRLSAVEGGGFTLHVHPELQVIPYTGDETHLRFSHPRTGKETLLRRDPHQ